MRAVLAAEGAFPNRLIGMVAPIQTRSRDGRDPKISPSLEGLQTQRPKSQQTSTLQLLHARFPRVCGGERAWICAEFYPSSGPKSCTCVGVRSKVIPEFSKFIFGSGQQQKTLDHSVPKFFGVCAGAILEPWKFS